MSQVKVLADDAAVGNYAANLIFNEIVKTAKDKNTFILGCPGGRTPRSTYKALSLLIEENQQDISHVIIAMMDEYLIEKDNSSFSNCDPTAHYSCAGFAKNEIWQVLNAGAPEGGKIDLKNVHIPDAQNPDLYEEFLRDSRINIFLMATGGSDGHVAFNPPGTPREACTRIAKLAVKTRQDNLGTFPGFKNIEEVPRFGVTVGPATMVDFSDFVIMEIIGAHKHLAFERITSAKNYESDWPSTIVRECTNYLILADVDAAEG